MGVSATPDLTGRELAVLIGLASGEKRSEIAARLHLSRTVIDQATWMMRRQLKARTVEHAVAIGCLSGLITQEMVRLP